MDVIEFEYRNPSDKDYEYLDWHRVYLMMKNVEEKPYHNDDLSPYIIKVWKPMEGDIDYIVRKYRTPYSVDDEWQTIGRTQKIYYKLIEKLAWKNIDKY